MPGAPVGKPSLHQKSSKVSHVQKADVVSQVPEGGLDGTAEAAAGP